MDELYLLCVLHCTYFYLKIYLNGFFRFFKIFLKAIPNTKTNSIVEYDTNKKKLEIIKPFWTTRKR